MYVLLSSGQICVPLLLIYMRPVDSNRVQVTYCWSSLLRSGCWTSSQQEISRLWQDGCDVSANSYPLLSHRIPLH